MLDKAFPRTGGVSTPPRGSPRLRRRPTATATSARTVEIKYRSRRTRHRADDRVPLL